MNCKDFSFALLPCTRGPKSTCSLVYLYAVSALNEGISAFCIACVLTVSECDRVGWLQPLLHPPSNNVIKGIKNSKTCRVSPIFLLLAFMFPNGCCCRVMQYYKF